MLNFEFEGVLGLCHFNYYIGVSLQRPQMFAKFSITYNYSSSTIFKALRSFFLSNFPGLMFIFCPTSIPESRVLADVIIFGQNWAISPIVKYEAPKKIINIAQDLRINKRMNDKCVWPFCCCWKSLLFFSIFHGTFAKFTRKKFPNSTTSSKDEHS